MNFEKKISNEKIKVELGYIIAYFLFTIVVFYTLKFLKKFPSEWNFFHAITITLIIVLIAWLIKGALK